MKEVPEDPIVLYARRHALHDALVDNANRVILLADMPGEDNLWALSETEMLIIQARYIVRTANERWAGFPMSLELRETLAKLDAEIVTLESKR